MKSADHFDLVLVGTGFASSFFLHRVLKETSRFKKILVLEKGPYRDHGQQLDQGRVDSIDIHGEFHQQGLDYKEWNFNLVQGGSSNGWWGCTPRMLPADFEMKTRYDVGYDWPVGYDELEPFYLEAERIMAASGPDDWTLSPRSGPFPQPPHNMSRPDEILKEAYPGLYYPQASARNRVPTKNRWECCAHGV
jgi:choline dehydrogenase-like flavoprotein